MSATGLATFWTSRTTDSRNKTVYSGVDSSEMQVNDNTKLTFTGDVAARLPGKQNLKVELIVNGFPVDSRTVPADGKSRKISFDREIEKSSWVAMRVFPRAHTNPIFILADKKPIRASVHSAKWCLASVKQCWKS